MTSQTCPYCGKPLEAGTLRSRGGNYYLPANEGIPMLYTKKALRKKRAIPLPPTAIFPTMQWPQAYLCRQCKKIIIPYED